MKPIAKWVFPRVLAAAAVCLLALGSGGSTCIRAPVGPTPPADGGTVTDCSDAALHQAELDALPAIESAAAEADFSSVEAAAASVVANLAIKEGLPLAGAEATCLFQWVEKQAASLSADDKEVEGLKLSNAQQWLAKHGARVTGAFSP